MNPQEILNEAHATKDHDSVDYHKKVKFFLEILDILLPAVISAAMAGNVTCKHAVRKMLQVETEK